MTADVSRYLAPDFLSLTIGIVVYFVGVLATQRLTFLRNFSIPEPVSGGFVAVTVISLIYIAFNFQIDFALTTRDRLLVIFFRHCRHQCTVCRSCCGWADVGYPVCDFGGFHIHSEYSRHRWGACLRHAVCTRGSNGLPSFVRRPWDHYRLGSPHCNRA